MAKIRGILANGALLAVSVGLALLLGELVVRLVAPQQLVLVRPDIWQPLDSVGWRFRPHLDARVNWGERTVNLWTDADGERVGRAGRKHAGTRVLLIGDSFMAALQVEQEQSLAGLLETRLPERVGRPVAIRNAGQAGWDPPQYVANARSVLSRDRFALVIVAVFIGNDVVKVRPAHIPPRLPAEIHRVRWPRRFERGEVITALLRPINDFLEMRSHLFVFTKSRLQTTLMRLGLTEEYFPEEFRRSEATSPRWDVTCDMLSEIATLAARRHTPTLFVLIPAPFQVEDAVFQQFARGFDVDPAEVDLEQPNRLVRGKLEAHGWMVVDVLEDFRAADRNGTKLYGAVDRHLSPAGHEVLEHVVGPVAAQVLQR